MIKLVAELPVGKRMIKSRGKEVHDFKLSKAALLLYTFQPKVNYASISMLYCALWESETLNMNIMIRLK